MHGEKVHVDIGAYLRYIKAGRAGIRMKSPVGSSGSRGSNFGDLGPESHRGTRIKLEREKK